MMTRSSLVLLCSCVLGATLASAQLPPDRPVRASVPVTPPEPPEPPGPPPTPGPPGPPVSSPGPLTPLGPGKDIRKKEARPVFTLSARPGSGVSFEAGDYFGLTVRGRFMLRDTFLSQGDRHENEFLVRRARLVLSGHIYSRKVQYYMQAGFAARDFDPLSSSPLYDAYLQLNHLRDLHVRIGQQLVPFNRARVISSQSAQLVDRSPVVGELNLDRDVGVKLFSNDLGGLGYRLGYEVFIGTGDGRNQLVGDLGLLYALRVQINPFGRFDDYVEADLERLPRPRLSIGLNVAYDQNAARHRGTTGARYELGDFDYLYGAADLLFKLSGFSLEAEGLVRWAKKPRIDGVDARGAPVTEHSRRAAGYFVQAGYMMTRQLEVAARWSQLFALTANTDPELIQQVAQRGKELAGAFSWYLRGHIWKLQVDYSYLFGEVLAEGAHQARAQIHVGF